MPQGRRRCATAPRPQARTAVGVAAERGEVRLDAAEAALNFFVGRGHVLVFRFVMVVTGDAARM